MSKTCRCHCRECGRHFASLSAFEAHRIGKFGLPPLALEGRRCAASVESDNRFVADHQARCTVAGRQTLSPVVIWALAADRERLSEVFG